MSRVVVILGAGASHGCAPKDTVPLNSYSKPPLVTDLFKPTSYDDVATAKVLARYPFAKLAAADLRGQQDSLAIEEIIRTRFRDSDEPLDQRMFRSIPPYLQELLHEVSYGYTEFPQNYQSLVTNLMRLKEVVFVSLNYDVILDDVLTTVGGRRNSMDWYIERDRRWSLIKLHGSVDWAYKVLETPLLPPHFDPPATMVLSDEIVVRPSRQLWKIRGFRRGDSKYPEDDFYYPALSVPVGRADELVCPVDHVRFLKSKLAVNEPLHLMLIGYSGNDREVMALIRETQHRIDSLTVVDRSRGAALEVIRRLQKDHSLKFGRWEAFDGDFTSWVETGALTRYVDDMRRA